MTKLKIIKVVQHLHPGGIESLALEFLRAYPEAEIKLVSLEGEIDQAITDWPRLALYRDRLHCLGKRPGWDPRLLRRLFRLFRSFAPDIVHSHHIGPLVYAGPIARALGIKLVHTEHDAWHLEARSRARLQGAALRISRPAVVADAEIVGQSYARHLRRPPERTILNGVDTAEFSPQQKAGAKLRARLGLSPNDFVIGTAGRLVEVKNQALLLEAFAMVERQNRHLLIAGAGPLEGKLKQRTAQLGLGHRVHFLGQVEKMAAFYCALDLFVLPSRKEGLPLCLLEAQACGIPVVATDVGGSREAVCPATGRLVKDNDIAGLARSIAKTAGVRSGNAYPRRFARAHGSLERMFSEYGALYSDLLENRC